MRFCEITTLAATVLASVAFAHDANTLAFYGFKEGDAGTSLSGKTIVNDAGAAYSGTVTINSGSIEYRADVPGAYVFGSESADDLLCTNPQSVHFSGNSTLGSQFISCADLGTAVSSNDDFTVEFFFKYGEGDTGFNKPTIQLLAMNCGLVYNPTDSSEPGAGEPGRFEIMNHGASGRYLDVYLVDRSTGQRTRFDTYGDTYYGQFLDDGLWHHLAVVYVASTSKFTVYLDYASGFNKVDVPRATTHQVLSAAEPLLLGNGGFKGLVSCLRVSKCARTVDTFLRASNLPSCSPETVFHWSFDGADDAAAGTLASPRSADPRVGQYIAKRSPRTGSGYAKGYESDSATVMPSYTNEIPLAGRYVVMSDESVLGYSTNAIFVRASGSNKSSLRCSGTNYFAVASGDWTMEGWFKMDYGAYKTAVADVVSNPHAALLSLSYSAGAVISGSDFSLYLHHTSGEFKLKLYAFDSAGTSYDPAGVSLGTLFRDDKWHHVAVVYDESNRRMSGYIDGNEMVHIDFPEGRSFAPRTKIETAREYVVADDAVRKGFYGLVDEVRLVRRALSPSEFISFKRPPSGLMLLVK
ncbi:MAG: hypothetical protein IKJ89_09835 [Kiritimatiellae bacterium]|nr:hypothetical protein [Kiritimatiellia bacterium]